MTPPDPTQVRKTADPDFAFTFEQPDGVALEHPLIKHRLGHPSSLLHCQHVSFDWCKVANVPVQKPTSLWVHNLPELVDYFGSAERPKFKCTQDSPCQFGGPGHHQRVRGSTNLWTKYPEALVQPWATVVNAALAHKRKKPRIE